MDQKASDQSCRRFVLPFLKVVSIPGVLGVVLFGMIDGVVAAGSSPSHEGHGREVSQSTGQGLKPQFCRFSERNMAPTDRMPSEQAQPHAALLEGLQVETSDITLHELFFETILQAHPVFRIDHPQVDHLRGYCYRDVQIVVRQDLKASRPTGWVQINFAVPDAEAVKEGLERALQSSPLAQRDEAERSKVIRIRLKSDVPRSNCRAVRLEVGGPEGFMIGFNQYKEGTCKEMKEESMVK